MFNSFFESLRNRRNGKTPQEEQTMSDAISVEIRVKLPPTAPRELGPALQKAVSEAVLRVVQEQMMPRSPFSNRSPFESPFNRSRRSPFSSPFGDDNDEDDTDAIAAILAMAMMAREAEENGNRRSPFSSPFGPDLSEIFRDQGDRMNPNADAVQDMMATLLKGIVQSVLDDYFDEDYSNPLASTAFAALALVRDEYEVLSAPEISQEDVEKALKVVAQFEAGVEHCDDLADEIPLQVLKTHKEQSITPEEVIAAYKAGDFSNEHARLAIAALAVQDDNFTVLFNPRSIDFRTRITARELVENYDNEQRFCEECDGEFGCKVQLAYDTLVAYQIMNDEEAAWNEHDGEEADGLSEEEDAVADTVMVAEGMNAGHTVEEGNEERYGANPA